jgi:apolipoprotein N-acyltransferase
MFYWLALPPFQLPWAAYASCVCWIAIVAREAPLKRGDYWALWGTSALCWLALLQGIRLAFWPLYAGWVALSLYLAVYVPLFVALSRSLHHTYRISLPVAAATVWVGLELVRAYFVTGFSACMLAHTHANLPSTLQVAAHFGSYGVSFVIMFLSGVLYQWSSWGLAKLKKGSSLAAKGNVWTASVFAICGMALVAYSIGLESSNRRWLLDLSPIKPLGRILLVQADMPTMFDGGLEQIQLGWQRYEQQTSIGLRSIGQQPNDDAIDLVVWPESTFNGGVPWFDWDRSPGVPAEFEVSEPEFEYRCSQVLEMHQLKLKRLRGKIDATSPALLVGSDVLRIRDGKLNRFNVALWLQPETPDVADYYGKQHLVMFGEYIPVLSMFPKLQAMLGVGELTCGPTAKAWQLKSGAIVSPTICFENVLPHVVRQRVQESTAIGKPPDILVNITNDGWFRGSSILNHHLNNGILAAVENRRPMLIAANNGISAWVDGSGRTIKTLAPLESGFILAEPIPDGRWGLWQSIGDWPARILALIAFTPFWLQTVPALRHFTPLRPKR